MVFKRTRKRIHKRRIKRKKYKRTCKTNKKIRKKYRHMKYAKYKKRISRRKKQRKQRRRQKKQRGGVAFLTEDFHETIVGSRGGSWKFNANKPFDRNPEKVRGRRRSVETQKP